MEDLLPIADCGSMQTVVAVNKYLKRLVAHHLSVSYSPLYLSRWYQPRTHTSTSFSSTISATSIHRNLDTSSLPMPPPSSTGIRRAISTASLSLTNRFMRHFSKSNLTKICWFFYIVWGISFIFYYLSGRAARWLGHDDGHSAQDGHSAGRIHIQHAWQRRCRVDDHS